MGLTMLTSIGFAADCKNAGSTAEIKLCANTEFNRADRELNSIYRKLLSSLDVEGQWKLKESQRTWLKFRDLNAGFISDTWRGGNLEYLLFIDTKSQMTQVRTKQLQEVYENKK
jgi:uncharacterized protein YecT (DUF1311 family)